MTQRRKLADVDDGVITGHIHPTGGACHHCGIKTRGIVVTALELPREFYYDQPINKRISLLKQRLIFCDDEDGNMRTFIGIGCGCYAKGHRQIAHIKDRMKS